MGDGPAIATVKRSEIVENGMRLSAREYLDPKCIAQRIVSEWLMETGLNALTRRHSPWLELLEQMIATELKKIYDKGRSMYEHQREDPAVVHGHDGDQAPGQGPGQEGAG